MSRHRAAAYISVVIVAMAIGAGLYFSGSPSEQRLQRLDERRSTDLRRLSSAINAYFAETGELPGTLADLVDGRRLSQRPQDPVSGAPYDYAVLSEHRFELCADFSRPSAHDPSGYFWAHGAGRHCFEFDYSDRRAPSPGM